MNERCLRNFAAAWPIILLMGGFLTSGCAVSSRHMASGASSGQSTPMGQTVQDDAGARERSGWGEVTTGPETAAEKIPLFPLLYKSSTPGGDTHLEALFGLVGSHSKGDEFDSRVVPVFWGEDYFHVFPFFWSTDDWWMLPPLAGGFGDNVMIGPVSWGKDYFDVLPFFLSGRENWALLPLGGKWGDSYAAGPVWWGEDYFNVFPFLWSRDDDWMLFPLGGKWGDSHAVGPVWWGEDYVHVFPFLWGGRDYLHVAPFFWSSDDDWLLLPLGGKWGENYAAGPVWWGENHFDVFPLFWSHDDDWLLLPLGGKWGDNRVVGPVWWGKDFLNVLPLWFKRGRTTWIPPLLGWRTPLEDGGFDFRAFIRIFRWKSDNDGYRLELQPVLDVGGGKVSHFSLFWRLFEYHRDEKESYWRAFFLPKKFGRKEYQPGPGPVASAQ